MKYQLWKTVSRFILPHKLDIWIRDYLVFRFAYKVIFQHPCKHVLQIKPDLPRGMEVFVCLFL